MLLVIDCGNTNIVCALYEGHVLQSVWRIDTHPLPTIDSLTDSLHAHVDADALIEGVVIASVVPQATLLLKMFSSKIGCTPLVIGEGGAEIGVDVDVPNPEQVGPDRLVNAAACAFLDMVPAIVVDFGTATTFDVVLHGPNGARYAGGVIAPGVNLSVSALSAAAARLPAMNIQDWQTDTIPALGTSTDSAMRSGILWGYVGLVEGILSRLISELHIEPKIIATGGLATLYAPHISSISTVKDNLTLDGLASIFARNKHV